MIYSPMRRVNNSVMEQYLETFQKLQKSFPDFVVGFDLVGQEDLGRPLVDFIDELLKNGPDTKYFFHAGK